MGVKLLYLARRAKGVAREDWPRTWKSHAIYASQFPVLEAEIEWMRYCNRVECDAQGLSQEHDGVAVALGDTIEGLTGAGFSEAERALIDQDELRVFDMLTPHFTWYCEETPIREGPLSEVAKFTFLARRPGLSRAEFDVQWRDAALAPEKASRFVLNHPLNRAPLPLFPYDGIAEAWFASAEDALASPQCDLADLCDIGQTMTLLTSVCHRWPKT